MERVLEEVLTGVEGGEELVEGSAGEGELAFLAGIGSVCRTGGVDASAWINWYLRGRGVRVGAERTAVCAGTSFCSAWSPTLILFGCRAVTGAVFQG